MVCSGWQVLSAEKKGNCCDNVGQSRHSRSQKRSVRRLIFRSIPLTAVLLVGGAVVVAVVHAVADVLLGDAAAVAAGELSAGVARPEQAAGLVAVVAAVVVVVAAVVVGHAASIATGEDCGLARVEGCQSELRTGGGVSQWNARCIDMLREVVLPDKAIKDCSNCGTACRDMKTFDSIVSVSLISCFSMGVKSRKSKHTHQRS